MGRSRPMWPIITVVAVVAALVTAGVVILLTGDEEAEAGAVRFQNAAQTGPDPFTEPAEVRSAQGVPPADGSGAGQAQPSPPPAEGQTGEPAPGTFGGTGSNLVCDREKLIRSLLASPERLRAWAEVVGIQPTAAVVTAYIRELRPVTLTRDTQVTNHSFTGGTARPYQAILQTGTAVLVDKDGKPVARCRCGNPLGEPVELKPEPTCYGCPPNYQPPPPCKYFDYDDQQYDRFSDQDFERAYQPSDYGDSCYRPHPEPPPVEDEEAPPPQDALALPSETQCLNDPSAEGCEQLCLNDPSLAFCDGAVPPDGKQAPDGETPDGEQPDGGLPDGGEAPPDDDAPPPDGGSPPPQ